MLSSGHFQDIIESPSQTDLVVVILWTRLGTPLPERTGVREYKGVDGHVPVTGTEWEFEQAWSARQSNGGVPDLLVYRKFAEGLARFTRSEQLQQIGVQWSALQTFWQRYFEDPDGGFKAAFNRFSEIDEFETQFEQHLRELLRRKLPDQAVRSLPRNEGDKISWWRGSPYRGLQSFDERHAAIFFGRDRSEREITEAFVKRGLEGRGFMLLLGASGSGKSSIVRAGVVPALTVPGVVDGIHNWRRVVVMPSDLIPSPSAGLVSVLRRSEGFPELFQLGFTESELAVQMRSPVTASAVLRLALDRVTSRQSTESTSGAGQSRMLVILDQLEVIFTSPEFTAAHREALDTLFDTLVRSRLVWIMATMRSDFFHHLVDLPALRVLSSGTGTYHLAQPSPAELELIISRPAEVAGLQFELDGETGVSLAAQIRDGAMKDPASLPLLSFVLDEIYHRDVLSGGGSTLTIRSYRELGGLEGAIARHAESLFDTLPKTVADALPSLLLQLVEIDEVNGKAGARVLRQSASLPPEQRDLAERLTKARLTVADKQGTSETLRIAHEALLSHWPRYANLISEHREFLVDRRRLQLETALWTQRGSPVDLLLPSGRRLAEAEDVLHRFRSNLEPEIVFYIEHSIVFEKARLDAIQKAKQETLRRRLRRIRQFAAIVTSLLVLATGAGVYAWSQRQIATAALSEAEKNYRLALTQATGSVKLLTDSFDAGAVSSALTGELLRKAEATANGLPDENHEVMEARTQLLEALSLAYTALGDVANAQTYADKQEVLADALHSKDAENSKYLRLRGIARGRVSDVLFWKGDPSAAMAKAKLAREVLAYLALANPSDQLAQEDLIAAIKRIGDAASSLGELDVAGSAYQEWITRAEFLHTRFPDAQKWSHSLAIAYQEYGDTLQQRHLPLESAVQYKSSVKIASKLVMQAPDNAGFLFSLTSVQERYGDALLAQGLVDEAMAEYQSALSKARRLTIRDPANFKWLELFEATNQRVGEVFLSRNDFAQAIASFRTYLKLAEEWLPRTPTNGSALYDVANAHQKIGDAYRNAEQWENALAAYRTSLDLSLDLTKKGWSNGAWTKLLAMNHQRIAIVHEKLGNSAVALDEYKKCQIIPVNRDAWSPRALWPADVVGYCKGAADSIEKR